MDISLTLILLIALLCFLCVTNPSGEEFASWYVDQTLDGLPDAVFEQMSDTFSEELNDNVRRSDYLLCSVFTYEDRKTLGIGLLFFPIDGLSDQAAELRTSCAAWFEGIAG